jgi:hypothetical protein
LHFWFGLAEGRKCITSTATSILMTKREIFNTANKNIGFLTEVSYS